MNTMLFEDTNDVPFHEIAIWEQTLEGWEQEGLPKGLISDNFLEGGP